MERKAIIEAIIAANVHLTRWQVEQIADSLTDRGRFSAWRTSRLYVDSIEESTGYPHDGPGYVYDGGHYLAITDDGYMVPVDRLEYQADDLEEAERILWKEWARDERTAPDSQT
jgi:hypothetical protein